MKLSSISVLLAIPLLLAGCGSLDNPFANWFHTGRDARVYNPQTGQYEWPAESGTSQPKKSAAVAGALAATPAPQRSSDSRYFDPVKNEWVEAHDANSSASSRPKATPSPASPAATASITPEPPPPRPAQETGVYNPSTGKIEWGKTSNASAPSMPPPAPARVKHWWWPF